MAKAINLNRNTKAILKPKKGINAPSVYYAVNDNADGYNMVEVSSLPTVELFIGQGTQAHEDITEWTLFNSQTQYGGIGANAFARFQNLESVTIWQEDTDNLLLIDDNAFYSNVELAHIYVHPDLLGDSVNPAPNTYRYVYAGKSFVSLFEAYELITDLVVPTSFNSEIAPTTLTKAWLDLVFANMPAIERNAKTTVIVPDYFTGIDSNAFSGLGSSFSYLNEIKCNGAKSFNAGFLNGASWCIHLWLDNGTSTFSGAYVNDGTTVLNANFRTLAPYLVFANYFMSEYPSHYPVVGYNQFVGGDELFRTSPTGEYLWFSNIDFDSDYNSPTGLENDDSYVSSYVASTSGYYYCYDKTEILVIQGSGALTSAIVESAIQGIDTPLSWITKVVIPNTFTLNTSASAGCLDPCDTYLPNVNTLELNQAILNQKNSNAIIYSNFINDNCKFVNVIYNYNSLPSQAFQDSRVKYFESNNLLSLPSFAFAFSKLEDIKIPNVTQIAMGCLEYTKLSEVLLEKVTNISGTITIEHIETFSKFYLPEVTNMVANCMGLPFRPAEYKIYIGTSNCVLGGYFNNRLDFGNPTTYFKATDLTNYMNANYWVDYGGLGKIVGIIDGGSTYTNIKNRGVSMNYPTLTGIDNEANIQLLTPSDNALYLASDTGNLWQYDSGAWTNLFSGYTPTWYSNEDVTTVVLPSAIDTSHTYYVKLTAI